MLAILNILAYVLKGFILTVGLSYVIVGIVKMVSLIKTKRNATIKKIYVMLNLIFGVLLLILALI